MKIEARHLHAAADVVGETDDPAELGFAEGALEDFVENSTWRDEGAKRELDPLSLAIGVSIGALAGKQLVKHEQGHIVHPEDSPEEWPDGSGPTE